MDIAEKELLHFLQTDSVPLNLRKIALNYILGLTSTEDGLEFVLNRPESLSTIISFVRDEQNIELSEMAHKCLINISSVPHALTPILSLDEQFFIFLVNVLSTPSVSFIELKCKILANATRSDAVCKNITNYFLENLQVFVNLVNCFNSIDSEKQQCYDFLALLYGNLSRDDVGRRIFLSNDTQLLKSLFSYTTYPNSEIRRIGAAILVKNICFEIDCQKLDELDVLPAFLLPIMGPEDFAEREMEKLPVDCQYLGESQKREPNHHIRIMLLESLFKLCSTKFGRKYLDGKGVYSVLRELHKWETNDAVIKACEDVIGILIRDESEIKADNFADVNIPQYLLKEFEDLTVTTCEMPHVVT